MPDGCGQCARQAGGNRAPAAPPDGVCPRGWVCLCSEYEASVLASLEGSAGQAADKQAERVRAVYQRQLKVPLAGNPEVLAEYEAWEKQRGKVRLGWGARWGASWVRGSLGEAARQGEVGCGGRAGRLLGVGWRCCARERSV